MINIVPVEVVPLWLIKEGTGKHINKITGIPSLYKKKCSSFFIENYSSD